MNNTIKNKIDKIRISYEPEEAVVKINKLIKARGGDLSGCDLSWCDLSGCNLRRARFGGANLTGCDLSNAKMYRAYLGDADLTNSDLSYVDLSGVFAPSANFSGANMRFADLTRADLTCSTFCKTNLTSACLINSDLTRVDLSNAYLTGTDLTGAKTDNKFYSFSGFGAAVCRINYDATDDIVWHKVFIGSLVDWQKYIKNAYPKLSKIEKMEYRQVINVLKFLRSKEQAQNLK